MNNNELGILPNYSFYISSLCVFTPEIVAVFPSPEETNWSSAETATEAKLTIIAQIILSVQALSCRRTDGQIFRI